MIRYYTAESVTEGHPDKLCDKIADRILDVCLAIDPAARVACEVLATKGRIVVAGEITVHDLPDLSAIVADTLRGIGYDPAGYAIDIHVHAQSEDIAAAVNNPFPALLPAAGAGTASDTLGAGDQGVMVGYATDETAQYLPMPVVLAHRLTNLLTLCRVTGRVQGIGPDGKAQVTVQYEDGVPQHVSTVVVSIQHDADKDPDRLEQEVLNEVVLPALKGYPVDEDLDLYINPSGRFVTGGPDADTGLTGRKLMVDTYGSIAPHGGGAFSGKDPTKVDRSGAYMARYIAVNLVAAGLCKRCQVTLAYAIGVAEPVMVEVDTFGTGTACADDCLSGAVAMVFDLTPAGIIDTLDLRRPIYADTASGGHFGRDQFPWERTDKVTALRDTIL